MTVRGSGSGHDLFEDPSATADDRRALDELFSAAYDELRRLAASVRRSDPRATLSPTALVNEAWLKLAASPQLAHTSRPHFKRIAARAMRQVLVEAARRRRAEKRGGGSAAVTFDEGSSPARRRRTTSSRSMARSTRWPASARARRRSSRAASSPAWTSPRRRIY
jgi:RNA polymerase sigma factor (TIGR02999 family)